MKRFISFTLTMLLLMTAAGIAAATEPVGLAAKYPGDVGIADDPSVIFFYDFEVEDSSKLKSSTGWGYTAYLETISIEEGAATGVVGNKIANYTVTRGKNETAELYKAFIRKGWDQVYLRFYTKFAEDHPGLHHFVSLRGSTLAQPAPSGKAGQLPVDEFSITIDIAAFPRPGNWYFYASWPEMRSWQTPEGVPDGRDNPYYGNIIPPPESVDVPRGEWVCVEIMVKMNTTPDKSDGELALWINGKQVINMAPGSVKGYWNREKYIIDPVNGEPFEGFRFRTNPKVQVNVVRLQHYVSEGSFENAANYVGTDKVNLRQATVWFDNVVMATEYIGPAVPIQ
jgi:hypothetical protein